MRNCAHCKASVATHGHLCGACYALLPQRVHRAMEHARKHGDHRGVNRLHIRALARLRGSVVVGSVHSVMGGQHV